MNSLVTVNLLLKNSVTNVQLLYIHANTFVIKNNMKTASFGFGPGYILDKLLSMIRDNPPFSVFLRQYDNIEVTVFL